MSAVFGVYLGNTSSCVAICKNGQSQVISNEDGDRVTPACVAFKESDVNVGLAAKQGSQRNAENTIFAVKNILGKNFTENSEELENLISKSPVEIIRNNDQPIYQITRDDKLAQFQPTEIAGLIFKSLLETAKGSSGPLDSYEAVLTVPVHFNSAQRNEVKKAAESAGFSVLRVINECTSPLLAYNIGQNEPNLSCNVLVVRVGGQSTDISVLNASNGIYRVVAHHHDDNLGGIAIDNALVDFLVNEFKRVSRLDCSKNERSKAKLRTSAEVVKHGLSLMATCQCSVEALFQDRDFGCAISKPTLELLSMPFIKSCVKVVHELITEKAGLKPEDIQKVVLCGGVTQMPLMVQKLRDLLPTSEFLNSIPTQEVMAVGAALQAAILLGKDAAESELFSKSCDLPCLPSDISLEVADGKKEVLFHKGTPVPFRRELTFPLTPKKGALLHLIQGDKSLLKVNIGNNTTNESVNVAFHFKHDGSLHLTCSDPSGSHLSDVTLESSSKPESPRKSTRISTTDVNSS